MQKAKPADQENVQKFPFGLDKTSHLHVKDG